MMRRDVKAKIQERANDAAGRHPVRLVRMRTSPSLAKKIYESAAIRNESSDLDPFRLLRE